MRLTWFCAPGYYHPIYRWWAARVTDDFGNLVIIERDTPQWWASYRFFMQTVK